MPLCGARRRFEIGRSLNGSSISLFASNVTFVEKVLMLRSRRASELSVVGFTLTEGGLNLKIVHLGPIGLSMARLPYGGARGIGTLWVILCA